MDATTKKAVDNAAEYCAALCMDNLQENAEDILCFFEQVCSATKHNPQISVAMGYVLDAIQDELQNIPDALECSSVYDDEDEDEDEDED